MLKQINIVSEDFSFRVESSCDTGIAIVSISTHELEVDELKEVDTAEIYLSGVELRKIIAALTCIADVIKIDDRNK